MPAGLRVAGDAALERSRAVAELDPVDAGAGAVEPRGPDRDARRAERRSGADDDLVAGRVLVEHVQGLAGGDPEPAPLADREPVLAVVAADDVAVARRRSPPGVWPSPPWRARNRARLVPARKQRSWESALLATGSPAAAASLSDLGLGQVPERESHPRERRRRQRREHVRLILGGIGRDAQQRAGVVAGFRDPRVVARGQPVGAEAVGEVEHRVEADVAVAAHARVGGLSGGERGDERLDHAGAELVAQIDREVRKAHRVRERARLRDRGGRAAAALGVVLPVGPQLERDRDGLALARA